MRTVTLAIGVCAVWAVGAGCGGLLPTIPVPIDLSSSSVGSIEVEAGKALRKQTQFTGFESSVEIGRGNLELDPSAISIDSDDTLGNKRSGVNLQVIPCADVVGADALEAACLDEGATEEECEQEVADAIAACLGEAGVLEITVWIDGPESAETVCDTGDQFGPFQVSLDDDLMGIDVTPSAVNLTQEVTDLLNTGQFALCVEVVSPVDGTVLIEALILNLGL